MLETSARLLRLLSLLQSRSDWTGPQLAERLEVTTRTVRADVERLRRLGYRVEATLGVHGGYRLGPGADVPPLLLDEDEAIAVVVGLRGTASGSVEGIEEASVRATAKILQLLPTAGRRRLTALEAFSVGAPEARVAHRVDPELLTVLAGACRDQIRTRIDYERNDGVRSRRDVEPHRLVHARRRWYLVAWDLERRAWRTFRVDRLRLPKNHAGPRFVARALPEDDPATLVLRGIERARWPYVVRIVVHADAAAIISRLPAHTLVEPIDDKTCRADLGADSSRTLAAWLGILDADFDIDEPHRHRELISHLQRVASRYQLAAQGSGDAALTRYKPALYPQCTSQ